MTEALPATTPAECCGVTRAECEALDDVCCVDCEHFTVPADYDLDEVAVERAMAGDRTVPLNRREYAEAARRLAAQGRAQYQIAELLRRPISRPGRDPMMTNDVLVRARAVDDPKVRRAAKRAQEALAALDALLTQHDAQREARERIARLERELADARAALRGSPPRPQAPRSVTDGRTAPVACRKCGKTCNGGQGRAAHERFCTGAAA